MPCQKQADLHRIFGRHTERRPRTFAVLADPEKMSEDDVPAFAKAIKTTFQKAKKRFDCTKQLLLVGGSTVDSDQMKSWMEAAETYLDVPIVIFPGDRHQVVPTADAILFLSLVSGSNPKYLIEEQRAAALDIHQSKLMCIPTGYLLIDGGHISAVQRVSDTEPIPQRDVQYIISTALAAQLMGMQAIYLEAGSGASYPVSQDIIKQVKQKTDLPIIVGGGLRTHQQIANAYDAGADVVVVGTALEKDLGWATKL